MKKLVATTILVACMTSGAVNQETSRHVVLPSSRLLRCRTAACSQLWQEDIDSQSTGIYPTTVTIDRFDDDGCPRGLLALYDKTVSMDEVEAAIYAKWAFASHVQSKNIKLWRVEPEKFAIQLTLRREEENPDNPVSKQHSKTKDKKRVPQLIFEAFAGTKCDRN